MSPERSGIPDRVHWLLQFSRADSVTLDQIEMYVGGAFLLPLYAVEFTGISEHGRRLDRNDGCRKRMKAKGEASRSNKYTGGKQHEGGLKASGVDRSNTHMGTDLTAAGFHLLINRSYCNAPKIRSIYRSMKVPS